MMVENQFHDILRDEEFPVNDRELSELLSRVYIDGGYTDPSVAAAAFTPSAVRSRGELFWARSEAGALAGMVMLVPPTSSARKFATSHEAELHLLAVDMLWRGRGLGAALVKAVVRAARQGGYRELVLWTQPTMTAANKLYTRAGFIRSPKEGFGRMGRVFDVLRLPLGYE